MLVKFPQDVKLIRNENEIILSKSNGENITFDESSLDFLKYISHCYISVTSIIDNLLQKYKIDRETLYNDIKELYMNLLDQGFLLGRGNLKPKTLIIELTSQCNERCIHCYIPTQEKENTSSLKLKDIKQTIDDFKKLGGEKLVFTGGEIFMYRDLLPLISYSSSLGFRISLLSNLTLLQSKTLELFEKCNIELIQTSIYGPNSLTHDSITNQKGSFDRTIYSIRELRKKNIPVKVVFVLMKDNKNHIVETLHLLKELDCSIGIETVISPCYDGTKSNVAQSRLEKDEIREALRQLKEFDMGLFNKTCKVRSRKDEIGENLKSFLSNPICDGGSDTIYLSSEGSVCPCPQLREYSFGNITKSKLFDIMKSQEALTLASLEVRDKEKCLICKAYDFCKWCVGIGYTEKGEIGALVDFWCEQAFLTRDIYYK